MFLQIDFGAPQPGRVGLLLMILTSHLDHDEKDYLATLHSVADRPMAGVRARRYPSDTTDVEWALLESAPLSAGCPTPVGGPRRTPPSGHR